MIDTVYEIPPVSDVDFSDVESICGYQLLLCKILEREGGFQYPPVMNSSIREIRKQGLMWLQEVRRLIDDVAAGSRMELSAIPKLLDSYDFFFRVCNGKNASSYIREIRLKTVTRWIKGDKTISDTDVTLLILKEIDTDMRTLEKRYIDFGITTMGRWIDELTQYGQFINIPLIDAYKRLAYLLPKDLFVYFGDHAQNELKRQWVSAYTTLVAPNDSTAHDSATAQAYQNFRRAAMGIGI